MKPILVLPALLCIVAVPAAQSRIDLATIARIKQEGLATSQVMDHVSWLSDVYGPRVTGTPQFQQASEWAMRRFTEWGLANVHQERFPFGQGWKVERFSAHMVEPQTQPIVGFPRAFSPSTSGTVTAEVVRVDIRNENDFAKYAGRLRGHIVLPQPGRTVRIPEGRVILRMDNADIQEALSTPVPPPARPPAPTPPPGQTFAEKLSQFYVNEGVVALLERGGDSDTVAGGSDLTWRTQRLDGGTIFPTTGGSRNPELARGVPSATIAVEHYNRIVRVLDKRQSVRIELNIQTTFFPETSAAPNGINTFA
jgi:carboxypeptidase Q